MLLLNVLVSPDAPSERSDPLSAGVTLQRVAPVSGGFQLVVVQDPDAGELRALEDDFVVHPLAVEDVGEEHQRPKIERHGDVLLLVLKAIHRGTADSTLVSSELNILASTDFVVVVLHGAHDPRVLEEFLDRLHDAGSGPLSAVHAACDAVVDAYEDVAADLEHQVDDLTEAVFSEKAGSQLTLIHQLKGKVAIVRRAARPLLEPLSKFAASPNVPEDVRPYLRDVADHLQRLIEVIDHLDARVSDSFQASAALISMQQNTDMRKMSAGGALVIVPTLIGSIYGMNFENMPELTWPFGYAYALVLMATSVAGLYFLFKRANWL